MSTTSSSRDDLGRQKPSDRGTTDLPKQVKPVGGERSVEASPVREVSLTVLICTTHSRPMCTSRDRPMCTRHDRHMCTRRDRLHVYQA